MKKDRLIEIAKEYAIHTPMYIFDKDELKSRGEKIRQVMPANTQICYAIKANPFLVEGNHDVVEKYEVCSPGELQICKARKIAGDRIVFSGVNKSIESIEEAIEYGVHTVTVESENHLRQINICAGKSRKKVRVLIRLTSGNQFGVDEQVLERIIAKREDYPYIDFAGIHFFSGTQKKEKKIRDELQYLLSYCKRLCEEYNYVPKVIEYGPGLAVPYFEGENFEDEFTEAEKLADILRNEGGAIQWVIELGRFMAASCGYYITKVIDTKENHGKNYCIVDGGINHVNYYGQNMAMRIPLIEHIPIGEQLQDKKEWVLCGSLCTTADVLVRKTERIGLKEGDLLIFKRIGAYAVTEGIYLFLSRKMPEIYLYDAEQGMRLVRAGIETSMWNGGCLHD